MQVGLVLYVLAVFLLVWSYKKDSGKTKMALKKAKMAFLNLLPQLLTIMIFVGLSLAILDPETITKVTGSESGLLGVGIAALVGSITLIPGFVAFPLAATLLKSGAGYPQMAAFVSTLMAVGIITLPVEIKYFNRTTAILRNSMAFVVAMIFTFVISRVM